MPIRWGIIGCGAVTEVKSGPAFQLVEGSELVAVMRRDPDKARDYAERHGVPTWYSNADHLINDPDVDAVYVATPPDSHAAYTIATASAGKPVYVEKPMARTYAECLEMIAACERAAVPLFVAYYRRRLPSFLKVKDLVERGAIGQVRIVTVELRYPPYREDFDSEHLPWRVRPEISGGGYFFDLASHQLDFLDYVFGPIHSARGHAGNQAGRYPGEDVVAASWEFESGCCGSGTWCFTVSEHARADRIEIVGTKGRIEFPTFDHRPVVVHTADGSEEFLLPKPKHVAQPLIETVVHELLGRGTCPSTGVTAARTSRVMDEIVGRRPSD